MLIQGCVQSLKSGGSKLLFTEQYAYLAKVEYLAYITMITQFPASNEEERLLLL